MVAPLATVRSNTISTTFELKFVCFFFSDFSFIIILKQIRIFPFEILKSAPSLSLKFKKNN